MPLVLPLLAAAAVGVPALISRRSGGAFAAEGEAPPGWPVADLEVARAEAEGTLAEIAVSRPIEEARSAAKTVVLVGHYPTPAECGMVEGSAGNILLGLFTEDLDHGLLPTIIVFADNALAYGEPVRRIVLHEMGHRWRYNHSIRRMAVGTSVAHDGVLVDAPPRDPSLQSVYTDPASFGWEGGSGCSLCRVHNHLAIAERLAFGAATETTVQHRVPPGIAGTIPLIREHLDAAQVDMAAVAGLAQEHNRLGEARSLARLIGQARSGWEGWQSDSTVGPASEVTTAAWRAAYRLTAALYRNGRE